MIRRTLTVRLLAAAVALAAVAPAARAGIIPTSVTVAPEAENFRWTYAVVLPTDMRLQSGHYFTIYDFGAYIPGSAFMPEGWTVSASLLGPTPSKLTPGDDENVMNLTFTYTGDMMVGQVGLGNFGAASMYDMQQDSFFAGTNVRDSDGQFDQNVTATVVPIAAPGVPEPTTLALAALGLPLVGAGRWLRRKAAAA